MRGPEHPCTGAWSPHGAPRPAPPSLGKQFPVVILAHFDLLVETRQLGVTSALGFARRSAVLRGLWAAPLLRSARPRTASKQGSSTPSHGREEPGSQRLGAFSEVAELEACGAKAPSTPSPPEVHRRPLLCLGQPV